MQHEPLSSKLPAKQKQQQFPLTLNKTQSLRTYIFNVQNLLENSMALGNPPGDGDGQGGLVCCDSWGLKESDTTE